ncbi:DNA repair exonuclease [Azospirillum sp. YIM B02556]|uniref:DNA repair exonuclease n=1 Tax=Azospirillum endophyticum TaxID=2800326 RepID=A0ABS1EXX2_9PROT|nr:DNA repair exonuclease [Azospirillum endophyticum]MBK1836015.1 DNA repair exonuclease [Azospirillum endophyticum]
MGSFHFLHAADIHLDSPLHGLSRYDGVPAEEVRGATRAAFDNLVAYACDQAVDFLLIAGDLFDGEWKDMGTGLYFARAMGRLAAAGIPVYWLSGNHDAASALTRSLPWPDTVKQFKPRRSHTHVIDHLGVAIHGQSFPNAHVTDNLAASYPDRVEHHFNIGLLHTALTGHPGHATYAPCTIDDLRARHYDYWALGHVHDFTVVAEAPYIVFPGNLQGRNIRETGPKGVVHVEVEDGAVARLTHVPLDTVRWLRVEVDCTGADRMDEVHAATRTALAVRHADLSDGRPTVARVVLTGSTSLAGKLQDGRATQRDTVRALAAAVAPDLWIEKVQLDVTMPGSAPVADGAAEDIMALLAEVRQSPELAQDLKADLLPFLTAAAKAGEFDEDSLAAMATRDDWQALLAIAGSALEARLTGKETE